MRRRSIGILVGLVVVTPVATFFAVAYCPLIKEVKRQSMYTAALRGDTAELQKFLDHGMSANTWLRPEDPQFYWLLHRLEGDQIYKQPLLLGAVYSRNVDAVKLLLEHGADVNAGTGSRGTPLGLAAGGNDVPMVKFLLAHGADPYVVAWKDGSLPVSRDPEIEALLHNARAEWLARGSDGKQHRADRIPASEK